MNLACKAIKVSEGDVHESGMLSQLRANGFQADVEMPFTGHQLSCWSRKNDADTMCFEDLVDAMKACPSSHISSLSKCKTCGRALVRASGAWYAA